MEITQAQIDVLNKLFSLSPDELLQKIAICKAEGESQGMLDALVSVFKASCEIRLAEVLATPPASEEGCKKS